MDSVVVVNSSLCYVLGSMYTYIGVLLYRARAFLPPGGVEGWGNRYCVMHKVLRAVSI